MTSKITRSNIIAYALFLVAWMGSLFALSGLDLPLSKALFAPDAAWALWIQNHGTLPGTIAWITSIAFLVACIPPRSPCRSWPTAQKTSLAVLLMGPFHPIFITSVIKAFVGRPRFIQLEGDYALFTHFYQTNQALSGVSFPSGHVATAAMLFPAAYILWRDGRRKPAIAVFAATAAWTVFTAAARIVAGAHYLTDTLFSFGLAMALSPLVGLAATGLWWLIFVHGKIARGSKGSDSSAPNPEQPTASF